MRQQPARRSRSRPSRSSRTTPSSRKSPGTSEQSRSASSTARGVRVAAVHRRRQRLELRRRSRPGRAGGRSRSARPRRMRSCRGTALPSASLSRRPLAARRDERVEADPVHVADRRALAGEHRFGARDGAISSHRMQHVGHVPGSSSPGQLQSSPMAAVTPTAPTTRTTLSLEHVVEAVPRPPGARRRRPDGRARARSSA